jgi:hypothetical protein
VVVVARRTGGKREGGTCEHPHQPVDLPLRAGGEQLRARAELVEVLMTNYMIS